MGPCDGSGQGVTGNAVTCHCWTELSTTKKPWWLSVHSLRHCSKASVGLCPQQRPQVLDIGVTWTPSRRRVSRRGPLSCKATLLERFVAAASPWPSEPRAIGAFAVNPLELELVRVGLYIPDGFTDRPAGWLPRSHRRLAGHSAPLTRKTECCFHSCWLIIIVRCQLVSLWLFRSPSIWAVPASSTIQVRDDHQNHSP